MEGMLKWTFTGQDKRVGFPAAANLVGEGGPR